MLCNLAVVMEVVVVVFGFGGIIRALPDHYPLYGHVDICLNGEERNTRLGACCTCVYTCVRWAAKWLERSWDACTNAFWGFVCAAMDGSVCAWVCLCMRVRVQDTVADSQAREVCWGSRFTEAVGSVCSPLQVFFCTWHLISFQYNTALRVFF